MDDGLESRFEGKLAKAGSSVEEMARYASKKGDVMLRLHIAEKSDGISSIVLKQREKPIYSDSNITIDLAEHSGIHVPPAQEVAEFNPDNNDQVLTAIAHLISTIRQYEEQKVVCEEAYEGNGIDRQAQVSITRMDKLNKLVPNLSMSPTYHSVDNGNELIVLEGFASGCVAYLPRITPIAGEDPVEIAEEKF